MHDEIDYSQTKEEIIIHQYKQDIDDINLIYRNNIQTIKSKTDEVVECKNDNDNDDKELIDKSLIKDDIDNIELNSQINTDIKDDNMNIMPNYDQECDQANKADQQKEDLEEG